MCLLGANGSGKTTLINILLGKLNMNNDTIAVLIKSFSSSRNAVSLKENLKEYRSLIRFCPQYDILSDYLTTKEHIILTMKL